MILSTQKIQLVRIVYFHRPLFSVNFGSCLYGSPAMFILEFKFIGYATVNIILRNTSLGLPSDP